MTLKEPLTIRFGKHKNKPLNEIPRDYLEWAIKHCGCLTNDEALEIDRFLLSIPELAEPSDYDLMTFDEKLTLFINSVAELNEREKQTRES